jgi:hypothetical protein
MAFSLTLHARMATASQCFYEKMLTQCDIKIISLKNYQFYFTKEVNQCGKWNMEVQKAKSEISRRLCKIKRLI